MPINLDRLQDYPAYKNVPVTVSELLSDSITDETWRLTEAYFRRLANERPSAKIYSINGREQSFTEVAAEVAGRTDKGGEAVEAHKLLLKRIREIVEVEDA